MKTKLFIIFFTGFIGLSAFSFAHPFATTPASVQVTVSKKSATTTSKPATQKATPTTDRTAKSATMVSTYPSLDQQLATFVFVINRGEVFSVNAPGELTDLSLSGFVSESLSTRSKGLMNETVSPNTVSMSGAVLINAYSAEPSTVVTSSLCVRPLIALRGLILGLTIDGQSLRVPLPFDSGDCRWRAGFTYRYVVTVSGGSLQVTGMTVTRTSLGRK